jgi:hypothetical protein
MQVIQVRLDYILVIKREGKENVHQQQYIPTRIYFFDIFELKIKTLD